MPTAEKAGAYLRSEDQKRLDEIRNIVITSVNNVPIRIDDIVQGGPGIGQHSSTPQGVVISYQTRLGRVSLDRALDKDGKEWERFDEKVQAIILMRKNEQSLPTLAGVKEKFAELTKAGKLPPGIELRKSIARHGLIHPDDPHRSRRTQPSASCWSRSSC